MITEIKEFADRCEVYSTDASPHTFTVKWHGVLVGWNKDYLILKRNGEYTLFTSAGQGVKSYLESQIGTIERVYEDTFVTRNGDYREVYNIHGHFISRDKI